MARPLSGLLVRRLFEGMIDGTGESQEIEFNIPRGLAIEIWASSIQLHTPQLDAAEIQVNSLLDIDGPSLAGNSISTLALYDARQVLDSNLHSLHLQVDNIVEGGGVISDHEYIPFPLPILTARNPGWAGIAIGNTGEVMLAIYFRWVEVTRDEFITLVTDLRS